jgi:inner membrane transporter RhtA
VTRSIVLDQWQAPEGRRRFPGPAFLTQTYGRLPPTALMLLAILSVQLGSALATMLFSSLGPIGTAFCTLGLSATMLSLVVRPALDRKMLAHAPLVLLFGLVAAAMELPFFLALQTVPLGIAATITFLGPLGLAIALSRRPIHFLWVGVATLGIALMAPEIGGGLDPVGLGYAAISAIAWASYVPVSKRAGAVFDGNTGLVLGLWAATFLLMPLALAEGTVLQASPREILGALGVALLSAMLPMAMEFKALQRLSARAYGILMTLEPAIAALVGAIFLGQIIGPALLAAIACVTVAAVGVTLSDRRDPG